MGPGQPPNNPTARAEYPGGTPAPADGKYQLLNVLGRATGAMVTVARGEKLPDAPRGFSWVAVTTRKS